MKIIVKLDDLYNYYDLSDTDYEILVSKYLIKLRNDYISKLVDVYNIRVSTANQLVRITSNTKYYEIGICHPSSYQSVVLQRVSLSILAHEYGSATLKILAKPIMINYTRSISYGIKVSWLGFQYRVMSERRRHG